jgi:hypothetical protein
VWVFSDPPKSVSELVTYVPSTLSYRSDFCSPYDLFLALFFNSMVKMAAEEAVFGNFWIMLLAYKGFVTLVKKCSAVDKCCDWTYFDELLLLYQNCRP